MNWTPLPEAELRFLIDAALVEMHFLERALWDLIPIEPRKWKQIPWGEEGGGFWVVALAGQRCLYYNDIEDGFNSSRFQRMEPLASTVPTKVNFSATYRNLHARFAVPNPVG